MSTHDRSPHRDDDSDDALREIFSHAAPRPMPPAADAEEIRRAVYAEWDAVTGRRIRVRQAAFAAAAAVAVAAIGTLLVTTDTAPGPTVAVVERVRGDVAIEGSGPLAVGSAIAQGARVETHSGQVALRLADGGSLRLAPQTVITVGANAVAKLDSGALYFDSDGRSSAAPFTVRTDFGELRDVGTQFVARLERARFEIGVRDGRVELARGGDEVAADAGERITVPQGRGDVRRESIDTFGGEWEWAERLAPPFVIEGRHPIEFLQWVARETGRTVEFADPESERIARESTLSGVIDLEPLQKLAAVLATTDLDYSIDGERIVIRMRR